MHFDTTTIVFIALGVIGILVALGGKKSKVVKIKFETENEYTQFVLEAKDRGYPVKSQNTIGTREEARRTSLRVEAPIHLTEEMPPDIWHYTIEE